MMTVKWMVVRKGIKVFRVLELIKEIPDKLYSGAIVTYPDDINDGDKETIQKILEAIIRIA